MRTPTARLRGAMLIAAPLVLVAACSAGSTIDDSAPSAEDRAPADSRLQESYDGPDALTNDSSAALAAPNAGSAEQAAQPKAEVPQSPDLPLLQREVIAVADVTIRVDDVAATLPDLLRAATSAGGYVAGEDTSSDPDDPSKTRSTVVLRIPTSALQRVVNDVSDLGELLRSQQDVQDVTEQVVDVESRVKSARSSVARIRILLDSATTLGQVVRIESQLARRESELESLLARQRALEDQTSLATLTVTALGPEAVSTTPTEEEEDAGFVAGLSRGWTAFVDVIVVGLTAIGLLLPFALAGALLLVPAWMFWRRRQQRTHADDLVQPTPV